jgi:hypothetical protein
MIQEYLMVNQETDICDNSCMWDGDTNTWQPPIGYLMLPKDTTPALVWDLNTEKTDWVLVEKMGAGIVGFTWDGNDLVTNDTKPNIQAQPTTEGTLQA